MIAGLDGFSRSFAEALLREFPELEQHARVEDGVLIIRFTPGAARKECVFHLDTGDGEITVGLGMYHEHFEWPSRAPGERWEDPIAFLRALVGEQVLVAVRSREGKWSGATTIGASVPAESLELAPGESVRILSWTGARDAVRAKSRG